MSQKAFVDALSAISRVKTVAGDTLLPQAVLVPIVVENEAGALQNQQQCLVEPDDCEHEDAQPTERQPVNDEASTLCGQQAVALKRKRRTFPYLIVAEMWEAGKSISHIAEAIGWIDDNNPKDRFHSLRVGLHRMHQRGYVDASGQRIKLPHRVGREILEKATLAGQKARSQTKKT